MKIWNYVVPIYAVFPVSDCIVLSVGCEVLLLKMKHLYHLISSDWHLYHLISSDWHLYHLISSDWHLYHLISSDWCMCVFVYIPYLHIEMSIKIKGDILINLQEPSPLYNVIHAG